GPSQGSSLSILTEPHAELAPFHTRSPRRRYSRNGRYGIFHWSRGSLRLDARELHNLAPLLGFVGNELAEIGRRAWEYRAAKVGKPRNHLGIGESHVNFLVQFFYDVRWRVPGGTDAERRARLIARNKIAYGWHMRQRRRARRCGYRQRA